MQLQQHGVWGFFVLFWLAGFGGLVDWGFFGEGVVVVFLFYCLVGFFFKKTPHQQ